MHSVLEFSPSPADLNDVFNQIAALIIEGRTPFNILKSTADPQDLSKKWNKSYFEGPHCQKLGSSDRLEHKCSDNNFLCIRYNNLKQQIIQISNKSDLVIEVFLITNCPCAELRSRSTLANASIEKNDVLLEQWIFTQFPNGVDSLLSLNNAVRSLLHFSQLAAWYMRNDGRQPAHIVYRVCSLADAQILGDQYITHDFPAHSTNSPTSIKLKLQSYPRVENIPIVPCAVHGDMGATKPMQNDNLEIFRSLSLFEKPDILLKTKETDKKLPLKFQNSRKKSESKTKHRSRRKYCNLTDMYSYLNENNGILDGLALNALKEKPKILKEALYDDRLQVPCPLSGKHHCQAENDDDGLCNNDGKPKRRRSLTKPENDGKIFHGKFRDVEMEKCNPFLEAIIRCHDKNSRDSCDQDSGANTTSPRKNLSTICDSTEFKAELFYKNKIEPLKFALNGSTTETKSKEKCSKIPSTKDQLNFRKSLGSAAQLVFQRCSGLPLTSSPAPIRRKNASFAFDSTLNSISAIKSALFESQLSEEDTESESPSVPVSPTISAATAESLNLNGRLFLPLLGSFEESVLKGRIEPVSTVQGFSAELGASGSFLPRHIHLPATVFFYTVGEVGKISTPYMAHLNLGRKGYVVPRSGTIQVTLFNPHKTVVKMFVIRYDLEDMPPNSHTFLRQRTFYVPSHEGGQQSVDHLTKENAYKFSRFIIHLRFLSGRTGKIYIHTDIRMLIFRNTGADMVDASSEQTYKIIAQTSGPTNPKYSSRK